MRHTETPVTFSYFCDFVWTAHTQLKPKRAGARHRSGRATIDGLFAGWRATLTLSDLPLGSGAIIFRLLFPDLDVRRRYGLKEDLLARNLIKVFGLVSRHGAFAPEGQRLVEWNDTRSSGCLGSEVRDLFEAQGRTQRCCRTIHEIDALLDELAHHCPFSQLPPAKQARRPREAIVQDLYASMNPREAALITQIILKDLRPILYPTPPVSSSAALLNYNSTSYRMLDLQTAMQVWHWAMPYIYRVRASLDRAAEVVEGIHADQPVDDKAMRVILDAFATPEIGVPVEIPKAAKGRGCQHAVTHFASGSLVSVETKYDGERMQIHIDTEKLEYRQIRIFSKSKRDSTHDRHLALPIIRAALGLTHGSRPWPDLLKSRSRTSGSSLRSAIIEAELVAYSERSGAISEFHTVGRLLERPAGGQAWNAGQGDSSQATTQTFASSRDEQRTDGPQSHLAIVFFDVLLLDGVSLLQETYTARRRKLEDVITPIPGFSMLAERWVLSIDEDALMTLQHRFDASIESRTEGLFLKATDSLYNDVRRQKRWVKLKKDYIPGLGDTGSFCVIGGRWDKERGRGLAVGPDILTSWFIGLQTNRRECTKDPSLKPDYMVLFVAHAYGLSRQQLEHLNFVVKHRDRFTIGQWDSLTRMRNHTLTFAPGLSSRPTCILAKPLVFELYGAGWTKQASHLYYELRWPRIAKIHLDREPAEALSLQDAQAIAQCASSNITEEARSDAESAWDSAAESFAADDLELPHLDRGTDAAGLSDREVLANWTNRESDSQTSQESQAQCKRLRRSSPTPHDTPAGPRALDPHHIQNKEGAACLETYNTHRQRVREVHDVRRTGDSVLRQLLDLTPCLATLQNPLFWYIQRDHDRRLLRRRVGQTTPAIRRLSCLTSLFCASKQRHEAPYASVAFLNRYKLPSELDDHRLKQQCSTLPERPIFCYDIGALDAEADMSACFLGII